MKLRLLLIALVLATAGASIPFSSSIVLGQNAFLTINDIVTRLDWGGEHHRVELNTASGRVILHYLQFSSQLLEPTVVLAQERFGSVSPITEMMSGTGALVGINANFYDPDTNMPIGFLLDDGAVLNAPYSDRATLAIEFFGRMHLINPQISVFVKSDGGEIPVNGVNRFAYDHAVLLYTPEYGRPQQVPQDSRIAAIQSGRVVWTGSSALPNYLYAPDVSWLIATGSAKAMLEDLSLAERATISYSMTPERFFIRDALQAGPMLLRSGTITLLRPEGFKPEFIQMKAARSALGLTASGDLILIVVTKGNDSSGMGLGDVSEYLKTLGAVNAMALDGGGSSSLAFEQDGRIRNVGGTRAIPVGLVFLRR